MAGEDVAAKVGEALKNFFERDRVLLHRNVNERSITHKLAEYLQIQFPDYAVDCEYNRHGESPKTLHYLENETTSTSDLDAKTVFPDIIVHKRGTDESNLMVLEVKKTNARTSEEQRDKWKLEAFTGQEYRYQIGLFLLLDVENQCITHVQCYPEEAESSKAIVKEIKGIGYGG